MATKLDRVLGPSQTCEWETPQWLFDKLNEEFQFTVDAAASKGNAKCDRFWSKEQDGFAQDWDRERVWVNPPWDVQSLGHWTRAAFERVSWMDCPVVVLLVPVKSDQSWWHDYAMQGEIRFVRGRLHFNGAPSSYPGPAAVVIFRRGLRTGFGSIGK